MRFPQKHTLQQIATIISATYVGDADFPVLGMNEIHVVTEGDIVFVDHPKYYDKALNSAATIILINKEVDCPEGKALLISDDFSKYEIANFTPSSVHTKEAHSKEKRAQICIFISKWSTKYGGLENGALDDAAEEFN